MNISGPAAVAKPEMLFYAPGDLTVTKKQSKQIFLLSQREFYNLFTEAFVGHVCDFGCFGEQSVGGHAWECIDLQTSRATFRIQNEVGAGVDGQAQCVVELQNRFVQQVMIFLRAGSRAQLTGGGCTTTP